MSRAYFRATVKDQGRTIQNAKAFVYLHGTTTPVTDLWDAETGGQNLVEILSNNQGEIQGWLDAPKTIDLYITDNDQQAFPVTTPTARLTWPAFTETVPALPPAEELALAVDIQVATTGLYRVGDPLPGSTVGKDKAQVLAGINAMRALTKGGTVHFGSGSYKLGDLECPLIQDVTRALNYTGEARASQIVFETDRGSGQYAFKGDGADPSGGSCYSIIRDLEIIGPGDGTTFTLGVAPCNQYGIEACGGIELENLSIRGFYAGTVSRSNHTSYRRVTANNNYYGEYFPSNPLSIGDHRRDHCGYDGNRRASIGIGATGQMISTTWSGGHLGIGPYSIYIESGAGGAHISIQSCRFYGTSFENAGNGHIYSQGHTAWMSDTWFYGCANTMAPGNPGYAISGQPATANIYLGLVSGGGIVGSYGWSPGTACTLDVGSFNGGFQWTGYANSLALANASSLPLILMDGSVDPGVILQDGQNTAFAARCYPTAVAKGQIAGWGQNGPYVMAYDANPSNGGEVIAGVAVQAGDVVGGGGRKAAIVQYTGQVEVNAAVTGIVNNEVLVPDSTTSTSVTRAVLARSAHTKPVIGQRVSGDGTSGKVTIRLGITNHPVIAPASLPAAATDAATTQTLANALRQLFIDLGYGV